MPEPSDPLLQRLALAADGLDAHDAGRLGDLVRSLDQDISGDRLLAADVHVVAGRFALDDVEAMILYAALAPELDARFCFLYALLLGNESAHRPTVQLIETVCSSPTSPGGLRGRLASGAPLRRFGLIRVEGTEPFPLRAVAATSRIADAVLGELGPDRGVEVMTIDSPASSGPEVDLLAAHLLDGTAVCYVDEHETGAALAAACGAFASAGVPALVADAGRGDAGMPTTERVRLLLREATLRGHGLVLTGAGGPDASSVHWLLSASPVPVLAVQPGAWRGALARAAAPVVRVGRGGARDRIDLWRTELSGVAPAQAEAQWADALARFRTTPQVARRAVELAGMEARVAAGDLTLDGLTHITRRLAGHQLDRAAQRLVPSVHLDDVVLAPREHEQLREVATWARHRQRVAVACSANGIGTKGAGIVALFTGPPGTGKTLAAEAVAGEIGLDLYVVNLAAVIDKYVGETEKHLDALVGQAEDLNVVLLFDEADALFATRSAAGEARSHYANQTISFLLQRIERYDGLAVLTTNLPGNVDAAFRRRVHHHIHFPAPDQPSRELLWRAHLDRIPNTRHIDTAWLANAYELTGGDIRNVVLRAAYLATDETTGDTPAMHLDHLIASAAREYSKQGRRAPAPAVPSTSAALS